MPILARLALVIAATLVPSVPSHGLERTPAALGDGDLDRWHVSGGTYSLAYYNFCTGWVWTWDGWGPNDVVGVAYDTCRGSGRLESTWWFFIVGSPAGYGFTGTLDVWSADLNDCPIGVPHASQPFLPTTGWNYYSWNNSNVPFRFVVTGTFGPGPGNPAAMYTDHPAAGATGPSACGTCYPVERVNHTFYYGATDSPLCPGSTLNDGVCDAALLQFTVLWCAVSVEATNWSSIKEMYR